MKTFSLVSKKCMALVTLLCLPALAVAQMDSSEDSLTQSARAFIEQFWAEWSAPNATALPYIQSAVDDQVNFFGKTVTRNAFMQAQTKFAQQWPNRQYKLLDGSENSSCDAASSTCNESGIVSWNDFDPHRGMLSSGLELVNFSLRAETIDGTRLFLITAESSSVIRRDVRLAGSGKGYIGPGDLVPGATAYYGVRAYDASYAAGGGRAVQVRRAADNELQDISLLPTGSLDEMEARNFCQNTECYVTVWYDQTGHGNDVSQQTASRQPLLEFGTGSRPPVVQFDHDRTTYLSGGFPWVSGNQPWSGQVALLNVSPTDWYEPVFNYGTMLPGMSLSANLNGRLGYEFSSSIYGDDAPSGITTFAPAAASFIYTGNVLTGSVNGTDWSDAYGSAAITGDQLNVGGSPQQVGIWLTGGLGEVVLYPFALSAAQIQSLSADEKGFFGF